MRDYQRKRNNAYVMPTDLWYRTLYFIRGYDWMKAKYDDRIDAGMSVRFDEPPAGKTFKTGDPTGMKVVKLANLAEQIRAIDKAKLVIPYEYMDGVWQNIMTEKPYPRDAHQKTYGHWKARFVYEVARNMNWI